MRQDGVARCARGRHSLLEQAASPGCKQGEINEGRLPRRAHGQQELVRQRATHWSMSTERRGTDATDRG
jgi:hypothetical protein